MPLFGSLATPNQGYARRFSSGLKVKGCEVPSVPARRGSAMDPSIRSRDLTPVIEPQVQIVTTGRGQGAEEELHP